MGVASTLDTRAHGTLQPAGRLAAVRGRRARRLPRGDGSLRAEDRRRADRRLGLRAAAGPEHLPLPLRVSGGGVADASGRDRGRPHPRGRGGARAVRGRGVPARRCRGAQGDEPGIGGAARADALDKARSLGVRVSRQRQGAGELARGPPHVAALVGGGLLRRRGVSVEPLVFETAVDLATETSSQQFEGGSHGVDASFFLVHMAPGRGPSVHRHAYPEVFVVREGEATFTVDGGEYVAGGGTTLVVPAGAWHNFKNTGSETLELT